MQGMLMYTYLKNGKIDISAQQLVDRIIST